MVALVLVCHSRPLALALQATLEKLYGKKAPPIPVAAGAGEDGAELGTDATVIMAAIEEMSAKSEGVLVLLDLGSAVMSAELALELVDETLRAKVVLCSAPLVEGAMAAAALSSVGATLAQVREEAEDALRQKCEHLDPDPPANRKPALAPDAAVDPVDDALEGPSISTTLRVENPHGLHARPAMRLVQTVAPFSSAVRIENLRTGAPSASARSLVAISCLDARAGDVIRVTARGADAAEVLRAVEALQASQFGDALAGGGATDVENTAPPLAPVGPSAAFCPQGRPLSPGVAVGRLFFVGRAAPALPPAIAVADPTAERTRLRTALAAVRRQLEESAPALSARFGQDNADILQTHRMLSEDPALVERAESFIRDERLPAAHAWQKASELAAASYRGLEQPYLRERARDVEDLNLRVLRELGMGAPLRLDLPDTPCILAVPSLLPSEVTALDSSKVRGIIAAALGPTSHAAILLRGAGVPVVDGVDLNRLREMAGANVKTVVAIDGGTGEIWLAPEAATLRKLEERRQQTEAPVVASDGPRPMSYTCDGRRVELAANVNSVSEAAAAASAGAEAIGLLRTEFLFFDRTTPPGEDEQATALRNIAAAMPASTPITVRTFDIGGDKPVPYLPVAPEANPFLGVRGLRLALRHRDLFLGHLRAILRAAHERHFRIMFPMVTEVDEVRQARALLTQAHDELVQTATAHAWPVETGMMVEVPAAALNAHNFVAEIDFFSIGTNDLTQYTLAAERGHAVLTDFADALHPAVLRLVRRVCLIAAQAHKWVGVCGEAATDAAAAEILVGLGVQELSVGVVGLGRLRQAIGAADYRQAQAKARACVKAASAKEARRLFAG